MSCIRSFVAFMIVAALLIWPVRLVIVASSSAAPDAQIGAAAGPVKFDGAQYYLKTPNEKNAKLIDGTLLLDATAKTARFVAKDKTQFEIPYSSITSLIYERAASPRYGLGALVGLGMFASKSKKHYLTIHHKGADGQSQATIIRLDKGNYQLAVATAEEQTGVKVTRHEE